MTAAPIELIDDYDVITRGRETLVRISHDAYVLISHDDIESREWVFAERHLTGNWSVSWQQDGPILLTFFTRD